MSCYLVEWYQPDPSAAHLDDTVADLQAHETAHTARHTDVRLLLAVSAPHDEVLYCVFAGHSSDAVTRACAHAGHPAERITPDVHLQVTANELESTATRAARADRTTASSSITPSTPRVGPPPHDARPTTHSHRKRGDTP